MKPWLLAILLLLSACGSRLLGVGVPSCGSGFENQNGSALFVQGQAVVTATRLPCLHDLPTGWSFSSFKVERDEATFTLDSDRVGTRFLSVTLESECELAGVEVPSDEAGSRLFVDTFVVDETLAGTWQYVFPGGCVEYVFNAEGEDLDDLSTTVTDVLGLEAVTPYVDRIGGES